MCIFLYNSHHLTLSLSLSVNVFTFSTIVIIIIQYKVLHLLNLISETYVNSRVLLDSWHDDQTLNQEKY